MSFAQLTEQPVAVRRLDLDVALRGGVPAAEQRLGGDREQVVLDGGQDLEAAIGDQPDTRKALAQFADDRDQTLLLARRVHALAGQVVGVEGVEK